MNDWIFSGEQVGFLPQLSVRGLRQVLAKYGNHIVLDVRTHDEWAAGHINSAVHVPLQKVVEAGVDLGVDDHLSVICRTGYRSNIAASLLKSRGYTHVYSVIGGMTAWEKAAAVS